MTPTHSRDRATLERWMQQAQARGPLAVLVGNGSVNDLSFARSLGRRGVPTLMVTGKRLLGSYTRYARVIHLGTLAECPSEWMDLLDLVASRNATPPVLFTTSDEHCVWVARHAERLREGFRFILPDAATVDRIVDKRQQYAVADEAGVPTPNTFYPESPVDVRRLMNTLAYPVILKPYQSHVGRAHISNKKVLVVHSPSELLAEYSRRMELGSFMIQDIVPGGDDVLFSYSAFWDEEGERAWLTRQKLRQFPPTFGDGSFQRTVEAPEVAALSRRLLGAFNYQGLVGVEFKWDIRDKTYRLMEINPRTVSGNQLAISAGVDLPWIAYRRLAGFKDTPPSRFRTGVKYVNEEWDVQAFWALRRMGKLTFWRWIWSWRGTRAWALGAWDDPRPVLVGVRRAIGLLLRR